MELEEKAILIVKKLVRNGYIAYFAGGYVRDFLMGHPSSDIDIATNAPPEKILDLFSHTIPVGLSFGVVIVVIDGHAFEVSTFRKDLNYQDGRKPESIELSTAEEDAVRRDFTINGLFYDPIEECIYDYVGGREDILKGVIRTIGSPFERFFEDRLRMIRAIRFSAKFGFHIDPETEDGIRENANTLFPSVAMERVSQEFNKMRESDHFAKAIIDLHRLGLLQVIFESLKNTHLNTIKHQVECFKYFPKNSPAILYLMELFPESTLNDLEDLCAYLKLSGTETKLAVFHYRHKNLQKMDLVEMSQFYANPDHDLILHIQAAHLVDREGFLAKHEERKKSLKNHIERIKNKSALINGALLKEHGIAEGKKMGALLQEALRLSIEKDLNSIEDVLKLLKKSKLW